MSLTAKEVAEILQALEASGFDTLDLEMQGVKLQLRRSGAAAAPANQVATPSAMERATVCSEARDPPSSFCLPA